MRNASRKQLEATTKDPQTAQLYAAKQVAEKRHNDAMREATTAAYREELTVELAWRAITTRVEWMKAHDAWYERVRVGKEE